MNPTDTLTNYLKEFPLEIVINNQFVREVREVLDTMSLEHTFDYELTAHNHESTQILITAETTNFAWIYYEVAIRLKMKFGNKNIGVFAESFPTIGSL